MQESFYSLQPFPNPPYLLLLLRVHGRKIHHHSIKYHIPQNFEKKEKFPGTGNYMIHTIPCNQTQPHTQTDPSNLFPESMNIQANVFLVEIIHHHPVPYKHGKTGGNGTTDASVFYPQRDCQHKVQYPSKKINLCPEFIPVHGLEDGQSDILDQVDGKRQDNQNGDPIRIFKSASGPQLDKLPTENNESGSHQSQQIVLPAANLYKQSGQFFHRLSLCHHLRNMGQINPGNGCGQSHVVHVNQGSNGINRHSPRPLDNSQDDLIGLPEHLVNKADTEYTQGQLFKIMEQLLVPVMELNGNVQPGKAVINPRQDQPHIQHRLGHRYCHGCRILLENQNHQCRLQNQLHRFQSLQEQELFISIDHRPEHHGGKAHRNVEQQQQEHMPGFQQFPCRHTGPEDAVQVPVADTSNQKRKPRGSPIPIQRNSQDVLHPHFILQSFVLGIEPSNRRRQAKIHNTKVGNQGPNQLIQAVFRFANIVQENGDVEEADDGMESDIQIAE